MRRVAYTGPLPFARVGEHKFPQGVAVEVDDATASRVLNTVRHFMEVPSPATPTPVPAEPEPVVDEPEIPADDLLEETEDVETPTHSGFLSWGR